jgi:glutamine amidotransferase
MIVIVDYGVGNLGSMQNMLKKLGMACSISSDPDEVREAQKIILPGVGAFDTCAEKLQQSGLVPVLNEKVLQQKTPVLGVCVGMQMLTAGSEEGELPGLGWVPGRVVKFSPERLTSGLKLPHMGWTDVHPVKPSRLVSEMYEEPRFYFVHSYHALLSSPHDVLLEAEYGYTFTAALERENILGVQFHPEKSHKFGMQLLENFGKYY